MKVSAVIPCFNGARFIRNAIASIESQTYAVHEIVVVDDGSLDDTLKILLELKNSCVIPLIVYQQNNCGVSAARNAGISIASGDWIAFLDADDIWLPTSIQRRAEHACALGMTSGIICHNYYIDEQTNATKKHNHSNYAQYAHNKLLSGPEFQLLIAKEFFIGSASVMMFSRMDAIRIGGFDSVMKHSEDFDFIVRFCHSHPVLVLSEALAVKHHHEENLSNDKELYFYSHHFSIAKNLSYVNKYSKNVFNSKVRRQLALDSDKFLTGYCNEIYEKKSLYGLFLFIKTYSKLKTAKGCLSHTIALVRKLIRTSSFGLIKRRKSKHYRT